MLHNCYNHTTYQYLYSICNIYVHTLYLLKMNNYYLCIL